VIRNTGACDESGTSILIRINKYLSMCGVSSRRGAETMITEGRIKVNGRKVKEVGTVIDEEKDVVKVDGLIVTPADEQIYLLLNKPTLVMTTLHDPFERQTVAHFVKKARHRVYPVGRLDYETEGALLLTNDGDLAYRLTHPKFQVPKIYEASVAGRFQRIDSEKISRGIKLEDGAIGTALVNILGYSKSRTTIRLTLTEGRKREVRQLCKAVGHPVKHLTRVEFAGLTLRDLPVGKWRYLTGDEVGRLKALVDRT